MKRPGHLGRRRLPPSRDEDAGLCYCFARHAASRGPPDAPRG